MPSPKKWEYCRNDGVRFERKRGKKFCSEHCRKEFWRNGGLPIKHFEAIVEAKFDRKLRDQMKQVVLEVLTEHALLDPEVLRKFVGPVLGAVSQSGRKVE